MQSRIIQTRFWDDDFVIEHGRFTKFLYNYLLTSQYINISGIFQLHDKKIMMEMDITLDELNQAKHDLTEHDKVLFRCGWVYVKNAEKNNRYRNSPKNETAYNREILKIPKDILNFFTGGIDTSIDTSSDTNQKSEYRNQNTEIIKNLGDCKEPFLDGVPEQWRDPYKVVHRKSWEKSPPVVLSKPLSDMQPEDFESFMLNNLQGGK